MVGGSRWGPMRISSNMVPRPMMKSSSCLPSWRSCVMPNPVVSSKKTATRAKRSRSSTTEALTTAPIVSLPSCMYRSAFLGRFSRSSSAWHDLNCAPICRSRWSPDLNESVAIRGAWPTARSLIERAETGLLNEVLFQNKNRLLFIAVVFFWGEIDRPNPVGSSGIQCGQYAEVELVESRVCSSWFGRKAEGSQPSLSLPTSTTYCFHGVCCSSLSWSTES